MERDLYKLTPTPAILPHKPRERTTATANCTFSNTDNLNYLRSSKWLSLDLISKQTNTPTIASRLIRKRIKAPFSPRSATDFDPEPHKRLFRQFANPAPLGLCGFALTTFVLSFNQCPGPKCCDPEHRHRTRYVSNCFFVHTRWELMVALAYGGLAQFMAGMWELRVGIRLVRSRSVRTVASGSVLRVFLSRSLMSLVPTPVHRNSTMRSGTI